MFHTNFKLDVIRPNLKSSLLWGAIACAMGISAHAETVKSPVAHNQTVHQFSLAAAPLATTLREISRVSGTNIKFDATDVQDAKAPAISGAMTAIEAVQQALVGSGLTMNMLANGTIQVSVHRLGVITVTATRSEAEQGFKASRSSTATRSGAELKEVPQAVTVVTAKVIETQQAQSVQDLLQNVAGVVTNESAQGVASYRVRGFASSGVSNGISNPYASSTNVAGIDRIEVLKGPSAILSGADALGGVVNIVTKKPTAERIRDVTVGYASHRDVSAAVDIGDAITDDEKLSYRVVAAGAQADHNDADYDGRENSYLLSALRWKDDATDLTVGFSYDDSYSPQNRYTYGFNGVQDIPSMRLGGRHNGIEVLSKSGFYDLEQVIQPWLTVVSRMQYTDTDQDLNVWNTIFPMSVDDMIMGMSNSNNVQSYQTLSGDHYARFEFDTGAVSHKLSTGINHSRTKYTQTEYSGDVLAVDVYGDQVDFPNMRSAENLWSITKGDSSSMGYFAQDLLSWNDWHVLLGARRTKSTYKPTSTVYPNFNSTEVSDKLTRYSNSFNAGIVYDLTANTSVYASYANGFDPQTPSGVMCEGGTNFEDMETKSKEIGIKGESPEGALSWSVAAYQQEQNNVLDEVAPTYCYKLLKGNEVKGLEIETAGRILPGWNMTFNYTYNDTKNIGNPDEVAGAQPDHQASLWTTYDFQDGGLVGYGLSLGITAFSESRLGYTTEDTMAPGGARVDVGASYQSDDEWSLRLGIKNVFDRTLYGYAGTPLYVPVYEGRSMNLTWKYSF